MPDPRASERPSWLAPMADPKSEEILRAAFEVFVEHGLHCATMQEVARRARVSKETLYARFDSKEGLYYALLAWGARQASVNVHDCATGIERDPVAALHDYARAMVTSFMRPEALAVYRMAIAEAGRDPELGRNFDELACYGSQDLLPAFVAALTERGLIAPAPLGDMFDAFIGLLKGNLHHCVLSGSRAQPDQAELDAHAARAINLWLRAFAPQPMALAVAAE